MTTRKPLLALTGLLFLALLLTPTLAQEAEPEEAPDNPFAEEDAAALAVIDEIVKEVEAARGLEFKEEFTRHVVSSEEVKALSLEMMREEIPEEYLEKGTKLWARLGFFPMELDVIETFSQFLEAGAAGFYDPKKKALFLVRGFSPEGGKPVIFHELVHALEDQYFGLDKVMEAFEDNSDKASAAQSVVEGSASYLQNEFTKAHPELMQAMMADSMKNAGKQMRMINEVPSVFIGGVGFFPYGNAPAWLEAVTGGDVGKIADLYKNLPESTEQVMHPEKYGPEGDSPSEIRMPDLTDTVPEGWKADFSDTLGELHVGLLLNEFGGGPGMAKVFRMMGAGGQSVSFKGEVRKASEGWDGDRVDAYFGPDGRVALVWVSVWDTPEDAEEFASAYTKGYMQYKKPKLPADGQDFFVKIDGKTVVIAEGFPEGTNEKIAEAAFTKAGIEER